MATINPNRVRRGELFLIEEGTYSDRKTLACFRVLRNFSPFERLKVFTKMYPDMADPLNSEGFTSWLEFQQPVKLVTRVRVSIFSLEELPNGYSAFPPTFYRIDPTKNPTYHLFQSQVESEPGEKE